MCVYIYKCNKYLVCFKTKSQHFCEALVKPDDFRCRGLRWQWAKMPKSKSIRCNPLFSPPFLPLSVLSPSPTGVCHGIIYRNHCVACPTAKRSCLVAFTLQKCLWDFSQNFGISKSSMLCSKQIFDHYNDFSDSRMNYNALCKQQVCKIL